MKNQKLFSTISLIALLSLSVSARAGEDQYMQTMKKNIDAIYAANTSEALQTSINAFERIASVETSRWEPVYYAAFGYLMLSARETDSAKKDQYIDLAMTAVEKGKMLAPNESELFALEGFGHMMRVSIDPASRGARLAGVSVQAYQKALSLNPDNPRALALLAQMQYGSAQFFGSSTNEACETSKAALAKFQTYHSDNVLAPTWGRKMAEGMKDKCN